MQKGIIIHDNIAFRKLISINFEVYANVELIALADANACMEYLKNDTKIDIIISKNNIGEENTILKTFYYVNSNKLNIPIICLGECFKLSTEKLVSIIGDVTKDITPIIRKGAKQLGVTAEKMAELEVNDSYPISSKHFTMLESSPVDVYATDDSKEILFKRGEEIDKKKVRDIIFTGKQFFYVHKLDRLKFVNDLTSQGSKTIDANHLKKYDQVQATLDHYEKSKTTILKTGLNEKTIEAAKETIGQIVQVVNTSSDLSELLLILEELKGSYHYQHSMLLALLCHYVVSASKWGTKKLKEVACFVAYFHDIALESDEHVKINSDQELRENIFELADQKKILEHAFVASQMLQNVKEVPHGAVECIIEHHGKKNGIGFATELPNDLSPFASAFIVCEDLVHTILSEKSNKGFNLKIEAGLLCQKYTKGHYKSAADIISQLKTI